jgi:hypothetical protein
MFQQPLAPFIAELELIKQRGGDNQKDVRVLEAVIQASRGDWRPLQDLMGI